MHYFSELLWQSQRHFPSFLRPVCTGIAATPKPRASGNTAERPFARTGGRKHDNGSLPGAGILPCGAASPGSRSFELEVNGDCLNVSSEKKGLG